MNVLYVLLTGSRTEKGKSSGPKLSSAGVRAGPRGNGKAPNQRAVSALKSTGAKKQAEGNHGLLHFDTRLWLWLWLTIHFIVLYSFVMFLCLSDGRRRRH